MTDTALIIIALGTLALLGLICSALFAWRALRLSRQLRAWQEKMAEEGSAASQVPPVKSEKPASNFSPELSKAQILSRLQERRPLREAPEKYRHVVSLTEHGLGTAEIASILNLASEEVEQLVTLAGAARKKSRNLPDTARFKQEALELIAKDFR